MKEKWKNQQYVDIVEVQLYIHQMQKYMVENMEKENVICVGIVEHS